MSTPARSRDQPSPRSSFTLTPSASASFRAIRRLGDIGVYSEYQHAVSEEIKGTERE